MIRRLFNKHVLTNVLPVLILLGISVSIAILNYIPGTWLSGWDNLHPELNFPLNIKRSIFALWQEYQGLGLLGGMAHAADLPRQLILYLFSFILPTHFLRYLWTFAMLVIGPIGVFFLIKQSFASHQDEIKSIAAFTAGAFYIFNLAAVQTFFTPYESFVTFYGILPWLLYSTVRYLKFGGRSNLLFAFLVSIFAAPAFYVQTMFVVYAIILSILLFESLIRSGLGQLFKIAKLSLVILAANAFWLLPVLYFTVTSSDLVQESKINSFATIETQLMNQGFGQADSVALLKGFWFDYTDVNESGEYEYLLKDWRQHVSNEVEVVGLLLFSLSLFGILANLLRNKTDWKITSTALFGISYFMLASSNPPLGGLFELFNDKIPLFAQMFRSVFTKWSLVAALAYGWGLAALVVALGSFLKGKFRPFLVFLLSGVLIAAMIVVTRPIFSGKLISKNMRVKIPDAYFELFDYLNNQSQQKRIAFFPTYTFFGWNFHDWGYGGSGFIWYAVKQPVLDRAFDVWSLENESFYHEFSRAVYNTQAEDLQRVFNKYDVSYLLVDESVYLPEREKNIFKTNEVKEALSTLDSQITWQSDFLTLYEFPEIAQRGFVYSPNQYAFVEGQNRFSRQDSLSEQYEFYIEKPDAKQSILFPFADITKEKIDNISYIDDNQSTSLEITRDIEVDDRKILNIPGLEPGRRIQLKIELTYENGRIQFDYPESIAVEIGDKTENIAKLPTHFLTTSSNEERVIVVIEEQTVSLKQGETKTIVSELTVGDSIDTIVFSDSGKTAFDLTEEFLAQNVDQCWTREDGNPILKPERIGNVLSVKAQDAVGCLSFKLGELNINDALLEVGLPYRSDSAARPDFCVVEEGEQAECKNKEVFYAEATSKNWDKAERFMVLEGGKNYWITLRARPPDRQGETWTIEYQSPEIVSYPVLTRASFQENIWNNITQDKAFTIEKGDMISAQFISSPKPVDFAISGRLEAYNCDLFDRGTVEKRLEKEEVTYIAYDKATICDFVPLTTISTNQSHILRITGEGIFGRGMKIHFFNKNNQRDDIETLLPAEAFDASFSIIPWVNEDDQGYVLNIGTKSFGKETSINKLASVAIHTLPVDWLASWSLTPSNMEINTIENTISISDLEKIGTHKYFLTVNAPKKESLLVLSQSYNPGWKAYQLGDNVCKGFSVKCLIPSLFFKDVEPVKVKGWANGWLLPEGEKNILLYFIPQYIEFIGFAMLLIAGIFTLAGKFFRIKKAQDEPDLPARYIKDV